MLKSFTDDVHILLRRIKGHHKFITFFLCIGVTYFFSSLYMNNSYIIVSPEWIYREVNLLMLHLIYNVGLLFTDSILLTVMSQAFVSLQPFLF